jgi:NAD(P)-dependent dehydrogenase (short-subunit alcohol dehydrogenase family)
MKAVVITGVSNGIGWGTTRVLLREGYQVFGSVRHAADAERLAAAFGSNFVPLIFDVTDQEAIRHAAGQVRAALGGRTLHGLVNNAGIAEGGPLVHQPLAAFRAQIEVNLIGPLIVTQAFAPLLGVDRSLQGGAGRIVNISSVGGQFAGPFLGAYHASKFGLEGLSDTLRRELVPFGIDVVVIGPGSVATAIWDKMERMRYVLAASAGVKLTSAFRLRQLLAPPQTPPTFTSGRPMVANDGFVTHTEEILIDVPLDQYNAWSTNRPLESVLPAVEGIPRVLRTEAVQGTWDAVGARRRVVLEDGHYAAEEAIANDKPALFRYQVWGYTNVVRFLTDYAIGEFRLEDASGKTRVIWTYAFHARSTLTRPFLSNFVTSITAQS